MVKIFSYLFCFRFKQHINSNPIAAVLCTEELLKLRAEVAAAPPGLTSAEAEPLITVASPSSNPPGKYACKHQRQNRVLRRNPIENRAISGSSGQKSGTRIILTILPSFS